MAESNLSETSNLAVAEMQQTWLSLREATLSKLIGMAHESETRDNLIARAEKQSSENTGDQQGTDAENNLDTIVKGDKQLATMIRKTLLSTLQENKEEELSIALKKLDIVRDGVSQVHGEKVNLQEAIHALESECVQLKHVLHETVHEEQEELKQLQKTVFQLEKKRSELSHALSEAKEKQKSHSELLHFAVALHDERTQEWKQTHQLSITTESSLVQLKQELETKQKEIEELWTLPPVKSVKKTQMQHHLGVFETQLDEIISVKQQITKLLQCSWCTNPVKNAFETFPCQHLVCKACAELFKDVTFEHCNQENFNSTSTTGRNTKRWTSSSPPSVATFSSMESPEFAIVAEENNRSTTRAPATSACIKKATVHHHRQVGCVFCRAEAAHKAKVHINHTQDEGMIHSNVGEVSLPCSAEGISHSCVLVPAPWVDAVHSRLYVASRDTLQMKVLRAVQQLKASINALSTSD